MPTGGTGTGQLQDATVQAAIALFGGVVPSGGTGTGQAQDASFQALLLLLGAGVLPGGGFYIKVPVALVNVSSTAQIPTGAIVSRAYFDNSPGVGVAYTAGTTITVGTAATPALFMAAADSTPPIQGLYDKLQDTTQGGAAAPVLVSVLGAPIAGSGIVIVEFSKPLA